MLDMVKDKIERTIQFLKKYEKIYKNSLSFLNGYLNALREFNLITFEESMKILSDFEFENLEDSKEEK